MVPKDGTEGWISYLIFLIPLLIIQELLDCSNHIAHFDKEWLLHVYHKIVESLVLFQIELLCDFCCSIVP